MKIGFIGRGRIGCSLSKYFANHGMKTLSESGSAPSYAGLSCCDIIFITVPDKAISTIAKKLPAEYSGIICHCSGALSSDVLCCANNKCSVHPMLAVSSKSTDMSNAFFTLEGDEAALNTIGMLLDKCGNSFRIISKADKIKYHAAACFASNFVISVCEKAYSLLEECGFSKFEAQSALKPLMTENMTNICRTDPENALTGPIDRNDIQTVKSHLEVLDGKSSELYRACSKELLKIAEKKHPDIDYTQLKKIL